MKTVKPRESKAIEPVTEIWTCKDGRKLPMHEMTDSHLLNSARMLQRKAQNDLQNELSAAYSIYAMLQGEMAMMDCERAIDQMESDPDGEVYLHPLYEPLITEIERRGLTDQL